MIWSSTDIWRRLPGIEPTVALPPIYTPPDKAAKSATPRQGGAALICWTQGRFMVDHPEGLTLTAYLVQREELYVRCLQMVNVLEYYIPPQNLA